MIGSRICLDEVKDKVLYHYTKSNGINGIMNNKCFWATKNDFLNDPKEFLYVNKILKKVLINYIGNDDKIGMFLEDVNNSGNSEYFVLSFSCCRDSITMWAEFGNANGYNIGFDSRKIIKRIDEANEVEYHGLVIYDRDKQIKYGTVHKRISAVYGHG